MRKVVGKAALGLVVIGANSVQAADPTSVAEVITAVSGSFSAAFLVALVIIASIITVLIVKSVFNKSR